MYIFGYETQNAIKRFLGNQQATAARIQRYKKQTGIRKINVLSKN